MMFPEEIRERALNMAVFFCEREEFRRIPITRLSAFFFLADAIHFRGDPFTISGLDYFMGSYCPMPAFQNEFFLWSMNCRSHFHLSGGMIYLRPHVRFDDGEFTNREISFISETANFFGRKPFGKVLSFIMLAYGRFLPAGVGEKVDFSLIENWLPDEERGRRDFLRERAMESHRAWARMRLKSRKALPTWPW